MIRMPTAETCKHRQSAIGSELPRLRPKLIVWGLLLLLPLLAVWMPNGKALAVQIGDNIVENGGFEQATNGRPLPWLAMGGWDGNPAIELTSQAAHTGSAGIRIATNETTNPWIAQDVQVEPGATYDISVWLKSPGVTGSGVGFKLEAFKGDVRTPANRLSPYDISKNLLSTQLTGDWQQLQFTYTVPHEVELVLLYVRMYGAGSVSFDDVSFELVRHRPSIEIVTDQLFYYTDAQSATVQGNFRLPPEQLEQLRVEASVYRVSDSVVVASHNQPDASLPFQFTFDPRLMSSDVRYNAEVRLVDDDDQIVEAESLDLYRIARPSMLREDGTVMVNGQPFFPVGAYHVRTTDYPFLAEAGINVVQGVVTDRASVLQQALDAAHQNGLKVLVPLYFNMQVSENAALTEAFVTQFKSHPAVLAWMIMDEPFLNGKTLPELADAYRLIRSLDPDHPTYMVEALPPYYATTAKVTDILVTDVYTIPHKPLYRVGEDTALAMEAAAGKPVWNVLQAMHNPPNWPILPTIGQVRNAAYQSLVNGLQGVAYYAVNENIFRLRESVLWPGLVAFKQELDLFGRLVTAGEFVAKGKAADGRWAVWQDGEEIYVAVVNTGEQSAVIPVPLASAGFRAELLFGDLRSVYDGQDAVFNVETEAEQALLFRITPYAGLTEQAHQLVEAASGLHASTVWTDGVDDVQERLLAIRVVLDSGTETAVDALPHVFETLQAIDALRSWADSSGGTSRTAMLEALDAIRQRLAPLAGTLLRTTIQPEASHLYGQNEPNPLSVQLSSGYADHVTDTSVTLVYPDALGLASDSRHAGPLVQGQSVAYVFDVRASLPVTVPCCLLKTVTEFVYSAYPGVVVSVENELALPYTDLLQAKAASEPVRTDRSGTYPFALEVINRANRPIQASFEPQSGSGLLVDPLASATLAVNDRLTVNGQVYVPPELGEGTYTVPVTVLADGIPVQSLSIVVIVDKNMLRNPGFEEAAPGGAAPVSWLMRQGVWVQDAVYGGQYAVALLPDANNSWNVINSDLIESEPGVKYVLKGWVKNSAVSGAAMIGLRQVAANGSSTIGYVWHNVQLDSDWTHYELELTTASNASYIQVYLLADTGIDGTVWFDDLYVSEAP